MNWQDIYYRKSDILIHKLHWQKDKKLTAKRWKEIGYIGETWKKNEDEIFVRAHNNIEWKINFPLGFDFGWLNNVKNLWNLVHVGGGLMFFSCYVVWLLG